MIELHRVSKVFSVGPVKVPALSDVSLRIAKGEFVVLTGASGAGKTTLLRLLYRDDVPSEGEVQVLGEDVASLRRSEVAALRRSIGVVFQDAKVILATHQSRLVRALRRRTITLEGGYLLKDEG